MNLLNGASTIISAAVLLGLFLGIALVFSRLYTKATKEKAFIRTGMGGQKVIMDGGALVFPILHEIIAVNMTTLRLMVDRKESQALITKDRMRVDVQAEFYVRVGKTSEAVAAAAQTLGQKTLQPEELKQLVEGKFVDALRAVAAGMTMMELHEKRQDFVAAVQSAVQTDLNQNGLELETVSLTGLDQTDRKYFNPDNAFDAEGLAMLTREVERRRKERNEIEQEARVQIERRTVDADREALDIQREGELAKIEQAKQLDEQRARTDAEVARTRAEQMRIAEQAEVERSQAIDEAKVQAAERLDLANQQRQIAVANKSREEAAAKAEADRARADATKAQEQVETTRLTEIAERQKTIAILKAQEEAEQNAVEVRVRAEAEKSAAKDRAEAVRIAAQAEAERETVLAEAIKARGIAEADSLNAKNAAENALSSEAMALRQKLALIEKLDQIVAQTVKPLEKIDGIKIVDLGGAMGRGPGGAGGPGANGGVSSILESALSYRAQAPLVDLVMSEIGIKGGLEGLVNGHGLASLSAGNGESKPEAESPAGTADKAEAPAGEKPKRGGKPA